MTALHNEGEAPAPMRFELTPNELAAFHELARWFAALCEATGHEVPRDPMQAVLAAAQSLYARVIVLEDVLQRAGIDPRDYLDPPGRPH